MEEKVAVVFIFLVGIVEKSDFQLLLPSSQACGKGVFFALLGGAGVFLNHLCFTTANAELSQFLFRFSTTCLDGDGVLSRFRNVLISATADPLV